MNHSANVDFNDVLLDWQKQMNSEERNKIPAPPKSKVRAIMDIVSDFDFGDCESDIN